MDDQEFLPLDQQEELEDLDLGAGWYLGPSLWSTDWTTETIVSQLRRGNINLNPRFQRRNAWDRNRKSLFIESLILGLPVPQLVLAEERDRRGSFIVIDGKQRLLTLRQFASVAEDDPFPPLRLSGLEDRPELNGLTYGELSLQEKLSFERDTFDNQTIRTVVIRGWTDERYLYSVFLRINNGSVQLSPQELRQALHPGPFSDFIDDFSVESDQLKNALRLREPDFRMRDVELVLRYFAYAIYARNYAGDLKRFLDETVDRLNKDWQQNKARIEDRGGALNAALEAVRGVFGERDELRKWNGRSYEKRINRAVFDIMTYYFSDPDIAKDANAKAPAVKAEFQKLCEDNREFLSSIEATTKSLEANRTRFNTWAKSLESVLGRKVTSPFA